MMKVKKAVIPAAGFGTRFLPATKAIPKEMLPIVDTPTLQYVVEEAVNSGITEILIILGKNKKCIEDHFDFSVELEQILIKGKKYEEIKKMHDIANLAQIFYVRQKEMKGSADAVMQAKAFVGNEPFAVLFGDDIVYNPTNPCLKQLINAYDTTGKTILGCQNVTKENATKYGIVIPGQTKGRYTELLGIKEKPTLKELPSTLASMGRYVFNADIFDFIEKLKAHDNGEFYLTDAIENIAKSAGVFAYDFEGRRYDVGDKQGYLEATIEYALRDKSLNSDLKDYLKNLGANFDNFTK
ncbi:MAG: UTP--glucose-1-phosphate uridylyltransferase GalU [Clostridia bacterium]